MRHIITHFIILLLCVSAHAEDVKFEFYNDTGYTVHAEVWTHQSKEEADLPYDQADIYADDVPPYQWTDIGIAKPGKKIVFIIRNKPSLKDAIIILQKLSGK